MKRSVFIALLFLTACNSISVRNSREKLIKYQNNDYSIKLNDSLVRIDNLILDEKKIERITIDKNNKLIKIERDTSYFKTGLISWLVKSSEKDKLLVIDGIPIHSDKLDSMEIEMSALKSVQVIKNTSMFPHRTYKKVIIVTTTNNDR